MNAAAQRKAISRGASGVSSSVAAGGSRRARITMPALAVSMASRIAASQRGRIEPREIDPITAIV